jgi:hypothetical protein
MATVLVRAVILQRIERLLVGVDDLLFFSEQFVFILKQIYKIKTNIVLPPSFRP